jgi:hypothetical protein
MDYDCSTELYLRAKRVRMKGIKRVKESID